MGHFLQTYNKGKLKFGLSRTDVESFKSEPTSSLQIYVEIRNINGQFFEVKNQHLLTQNH